MRNFALLTISMFIIFSCSTTKTSNGSKQEIVEPLITMHKGACFGTCPVYRFSLYSNGDFIYEALRFHENHGLYAGALTDNQVEDLSQMASAMSWEKYPEYIESQIPDLPATTFTYGGKSVQFREEAPEALTTLGAFMEDLIKQAPKEMVLTSSNKEYLSNETLRVRFKTGKHPDVDFQTSWRPVLKSITPIVGEDGGYYLICKPEKISLGQAYYNLSRNGSITSVELK